MTNETNPQELSDRLKIIEDMLLEGRRTTERWGWTFLLWGVALYIATFWSLVTNPMIAWAVTVTVASVATWFGGWWINRDKPQTAKSRAIGAVWSSVGIATFLFAFCGPLSGHAEVHLSVAGIEILQGVANAASSMMLRWKAQFMVALTWWTAGVATLFMNEKDLGIIFLAATFVCNIAFGIYLMLHESAERKRELAHA